MLVSLRRELIRCWAPREGLARAGHRLWSRTIRSLLAAGNGRRARARIRAEGKLQWRWAAVDRQAEAGAKARRHLGVGLSELEAPEERAGHSLAAAGVCWRK